ncbi:hypothetical protein NE237_015161 [Protea cynaroides]|uniref:Complex 1 LYR protein domain-containing protein n=1 Tax=Protea cynaroides TaxID=273540 RepID=A0A9Q0QQT1_9MAGN|nr:hypothetical protein NE237_015161 [Protea cynaroides]
MMRMNLCNSQERFSLPQKLRRSSPPLLQQISETVEAPAFSLGFRFWISVYQKDSPLNILEYIQPMNSLPVKSTKSRLNPQKNWRRSGGDQHRNRDQNLDRERSGHSTMGSKGGMKLSGMQKQVLSLYRGFLRAARTKASEERLRIESTVSAEFRRNASDVDRKNFVYIEYLLRRGSKQLDQLKSPETVGLSSLKIAPNSQSDNKT